RGQAQGLWLRRVAGRRVLLHLQRRDQYLPQPPHEVGQHQLLPELEGRPPNRVWSVRPRLLFRLSRRPERWIRAVSALTRSDPMSACDQMATSVRWSTSATLDLT